MKASKKIPKAKPIIRDTGLKKVAAKVAKATTIVPAKELIPEETRAILQQALSNPLDLRTDEELSVELDLTPQQIRQLKSNPAFMDTVNKTFMASLPHVQVDLLKGLIRDATSGSKTSLVSSKVILEALGLVGTKNNTLILNNNGGGQKSHAAKLSDLELDAEIHRLLMETTPEDISFQDGNFIEVSPALTENEMDALWEEKKRETDR